MVLDNHDIVLRFPTGASIYANADDFESMQDFKPNVILKY